MAADPLQIAEGYLELGMLVDAIAEIENLPPVLKASSPALEKRMEIYRAGARWALMEVVARELWKRHTDEPAYWNHLAWAVRRAESIEAAHALMMEAAGRFPHDAMTNFNLGCYACQLGNIDEAKLRVGRAVELEAKFKLLAIDDPDLEPMWDTLKA